MKIVLENLTKTFPARNKGGAPVTAVDDFSYTIPAGELIGLLGPSGCGKSTMLHMLCGLEKPTSGRIYFGDEDVTALAPEHRGVGMVFQNYALYPHLTVRQNIQFPLENLRGKNRLSKEVMQKRVADAAALVQISDYMDRKPGELSGGQQQRVAIARALVKLPHVLLLDEPLSNLDARLRLQTREEIRRIQRETGITTIFVTHDQEEAMSISDHIVVMRNGVLQQSGKPQNVYDDPCNLFCAQFLGTPPINLFRGRIADETLYLGETAVLRTAGVRNGEIIVGVRPEGFMQDPDGALVCTRRSVEIMGRDVSIVCAHPATENDGGIFRAIISAESIPTGDTVRFSLKKAKVHLFEPDTGARVREV